MTNSSPDTTQQDSHPFLKPDRVKGKRYTKGIVMMRRVLGQGIARNIHVSFSPQEAVAILLAIDELSPRKHRTVPEYQYKVVNKLRA
jgi:predicted DNA-binding transcriptional regulator YafY